MPVLSRRVLELTCPNIHVSTKLSLTTVFEPHMYAENVIYVGPTSEKTSHPRRTARLKENTELMCRSLFPCQVQFICFSRLWCSARSHTRTRSLQANKQYPSCPTHVPYLSTEARERSRPVLCLAWVLPDIARQHNDSYEEASVRRNYEKDVATRSPRTKNHN